MPITTTNLTINIIQLAPARWKEYKNLRLHALLDTPQAFGKTHEEESMVPDEIWEKRLRDAQKKENTWIVFAQQQDNTLVGMVAAFADKGEKTKHRATIGSVFVKQEARGQGIAARLMEALLQLIYENPKIIQVNLAVTTEQKAAFHLYENFGFSVAGYFEKALFVNGKFYDDYLMVKIIKRCHNKNNHPITQFVITHKNNNRRFLHFEIMEPIKEPKEFQDKPWEIEPRIL